MNEHASIWRRNCSVAVALAALTGRAHVQAQTGAEQSADFSQYFSNGAEAMSIPAPGQPGAEYFSSGADATSASATWQSGAAYFWQGAQAATVPASGQSGAEYFSQGAGLMSVPAAGQPGSEYFSGGAEVTSVPAAGQPGAEYFWNGAEAMSDPMLAWSAPKAGPSALEVEGGSAAEPPPVPSVEETATPVDETTPPLLYEEPTPESGSTTASLDASASSAVAAASPVVPVTLDADGTAEQAEARDPGLRATPAVAARVSGRAGFFEIARRVAMATLLYMIPLVVSITGLVVVLGWRVRAGRGHIRKYAGSSRVGPSVQRG